MTYGCGADDCLACYPFQYACGNCLTAFAEPLPNGERRECPVCEYDQVDPNTIDPSVEVEA